MKNIAKRMPKLHKTKGFREFSWVEDRKMSKFHYVGPAWGKGGKTCLPNPLG